VPWLCWREANKKELESLGGKESIKGWKEHLKKGGLCRSGELEGF
jgi:hypothetical protein